jgi:hypothetical protein
MAGRDNGIGMSGRIFVISGIFDLDAGHMREMSTDEVRNTFPGKPEYSGGETFSTVDDSRLIRTFIWQSYLLLKMGEILPLEGNLRSFWYRDLGPFVKFHNLLITDEVPVIERGPDDVFPGVTEYFDDIFQLRGFMDFSGFLRSGAGREVYLTNKMGISFDQFVINGFFRFQDEFAFRDSREFFRVIGKKRPRYILYTEKEGLFWFCRDIALELGITVIASHGEPGYLTMEYFSDALKARGVKNVEIAALTDYDPWGYNIARNFGEKMRESVFGFGVETEFLTSLDLFTKDSIKYKKRDLTKVSSSKKKQVDDWMKITGGIDGEPYGMHIDNADFDRIRKAVRKWYKKVSS